MGERALQGLRTAGFAAALLTAACGGARPQGGRPDGGSTILPPETCEGRADCGPTRADFFDPARLAELHLTFDAAELARLATELRAQGHTEPLETWEDVLWARWRHCAPYDNLVPATMQYRTEDGHAVVMDRVGVRMRGTKGRGRNPLAGMKLYFDALPLDDGSAAPLSRTFAGGARLNLLSIETGSSLEFPYDDSLMNQCLAYRLMRDFDVPAPRCNHLAVFVNGTYYGLMQNADEVDDEPFLAQAFGATATGGTLYSCAAGCGYNDGSADLEYHGDTFEDSRALDTSPGPPYPKAYELVRGPAKAQQQNLVPMLKCGDPEATPDDAAFAACIQEWLDVPEWLRLIAGESLMPVMVSFVGAMTNYYLYFRPDAAAPHGGRFSVYSWDYDDALLRVECFPGNCDPLTSVVAWNGPTGQRARLVRRLTRVFRAEYCAAMNAFLRDVFRPQLVDETASVLDATMKARPVPYRSMSGELTYERWQRYVALLRAFMVLQRTEAQAAVDAACAAP